MKSSNPKSEVRSQKTDLRPPTADFRPPAAARWRLWIVALVLLLPGLAGAALRISPNFVTATPIDDTSTSTPFASHDITHSDATMPLTTVISFPKGRGAFAPEGAFVISNDASSVYYTLNNVTATNSQSLVRALVYTPVQNRIPVGSSEETTFSVSLTDTNWATDSATVDLVVSAVNHAPHILGLASVPAALNDNQSTYLFSGLTLQDVDNFGTQSVTLVLDLGESAAGTFRYLGGSIPGLTLSNSCSVTNDAMCAYQGTNVTDLTISGTPTNVTIALRSLLFNATSNRVAAGRVYTNSVKIVLKDALLQAAPENTTNKIKFTSINDPPSATVLLQPPSFNDTQDVQPFRVTLTEYDVNDALYVDIQRINDPTSYFGTLSSTGRFSGSIFTITNAIQSVRFSPIPNRATNSQVVDFRFVVTDALGLSGSRTGSVTVLAVNDPPAINGVALDAFQISDNPNQAPLLPFSTVVVADPDAGETNVTVTLTLSTNRGTLSRTSFSGPAAQVTAELRATTFLPLLSPDRVLGQSVVVKVNIVARDSASLSNANSQTTIVVTSVNAPPVVGVPTNQPVIIPPATLVGPFTNVFVFDDDVDYTSTTNGGVITTNSGPSNRLKVTVSLDNALKGVLTNLGGFLPLGNGIYEITTNAAAGTRALTNLLFDLNDNFLFPPNAPGGTRFTIKAVDTALNQNSRTLDILLQNLPVTRLVTSVEDDGLPGSLRHAVTNAGNNDVIAFALPAYTNLIRLNAALGPMELRRNLNFKGPGADQLTISGDSDGDGDADTQLFRVFASVNFEGLTLTKGKGGPAPDGPQTGGAIFVGDTGRLVMRYCAITDSRADQWGGAIDVALGSLVLDHCLVRGNSTDQTRGLGGGAISVYTALPCSFLNTTFSANRQRSTTGFGGGAIYAEDYDSFVTFDVSVLHCTFSGNEDAADLGTSIAANAFGTEVSVRNSIFSDSGAQNLEVQGAALILSEGGNVSNDSTRTILTQAGVTRDIIMLDKPSDLTSTNAQLLALTNSQPTATYPLGANSPAIGLAVGDFATTDQTGAARDNDPDSGAAERGANRQFVLNEIEFGTGVVQFLEFYLRRSATSSLNIGGYTVWVDGVPRHVFAANTVIQPGRGIIVANSIISAGDPGNGNPTDVVVAQVGTNSGLHLGERGRVELRRADPVVAGQTQVVFSVSYVGVFEPAIIPSRSITLSPQFLGFSYLPHWRLNPGLTNSPGKDAFGTSFGGSNAPPIAVADVLLVSEDERQNIAVLANDTDDDGGDVKFIVDVSRSAGEGGNDAATNSMHQALVRIDPTNAPLRGEAIIYDPRQASTLQSLPEGATLVDEFYYSILDYGSGVPVSYSSLNGTNVLVQSPSHRLTNGEPIKITGAGTPGYNGTFSIIYSNADSFLIATNYVNDPVAKGSWLTVGTRYPTQRSQAKVSLTILGANDPPTPAADTTVTTLEDVTLRIMADAILAGTTNVVFDTDSFYVPPPVVSGVSLLNNDSDPDTDDNKNTLKVVGVAGHIAPVSNYEPTATNGVELLPFVKVTVPNHGLFSGQKVLISGYGGHPSYNALHQISVVDSNSFTLPVRFVDNEPVKGMWCVLDDATRLVAKSLQGSDVKLEIRADRIETSIIYNPRVSEVLNHLGVDTNGVRQVTNDTFYYVAQDSHGALAFAQVVVAVAGVNDTPVPRNDPSSLSVFNPLVGPGQSMSNIVDGLEPLYYLPPVSGNPNRVDVRVEFGGQNYFLSDLWTTDEETPLPIPASVLLGNDSDVDFIDRLRITTVSSQSHQGATLTLVGGGATVIYDPTASTNILNRLAREELVSDAFEITVSDGVGGSVTTLVAVLVVGVNDTPVAHDDHSGTPEDVAIAFDPTRFPNGTNSLWDYDLDINGHLPDNRLTVMPVENFTTPGGARVDIRTNTFFYNPTISAFLDGLAFDQTFNDTFTYTVTDGSFLFAQNDAFKVQADGTGFRLNVRANDVSYNPQGTSFSIVRVGAPSDGGSATLDSGTNIIYSPEINFVGDEYFTYTVADEFGNEDTALVTVSVTVNQLNGQLQANPDDFSVAKGESVELDVLANDNIVPTPGSLLTILAVSTPSAGGTASISAGRIAYTPSPTNPSGMYLETFTYQISGGGTARATALVRVVVTNRLTTLAIQDDAFTVPAASHNNGLAVLFNDGILPEGGGGLKIASINTNGLHGLAQIAPDGTTIIYTPDAAFVGLETNLTYVASDTVGGTGSGRVNIFVGGLSTCADAFVVNSTNAADLDVLANDRVLQGPWVTLSLLAITPLANALGTVSITNNNLRFIPSGVIGETNFIYTISDGAGGTATGVVSVATASAAAGEQLFANPDTYAVLRGSVVNTLNVLSNDVAVPNFGRPTTIGSIGTGIDAPNHGGVVTISPDNRQLLYTPAPGFSGEETFTYTMTDSRSTDTAKVILKVSAGALIADNDEFTVYFETNASGPLQFTLPVLVNDQVLPDFGQVLTITGVGINDTNAANAPSLQGDVAINGDATALLYTPRDTHPPYVERFTYEITDGTARRAQGIVRVKVQYRVNVRDIETHDDYFSVAANSLANALAVLVNDGVKPASAAAWTNTGFPELPLHGVVVKGAGGTVIYTPNTNFVGTDHFKYSVADGLGGTGTGEVTVKVGEVNVGLDSFAVISGTTNNLLSVLANDFIALPDGQVFPAGKVFLIGDVGVPDRGGKAMATPNGLAILYAPNPDYGTNVPATYPYQERFWYDVLDDSGGKTRALVTVDVFEAGSDRDQALITITVQGVNDAPTITNAVPPPLLTDKNPGTPFANVIIHDVDNQGMELLTVTVILDEVVKGYLANLGGFVQGPPGTYTLTGVTPTNATTAIRGLVFVPTENRITVPTIESTIFTILANDSHVTTTSSVAQPVRAVNDVPIISGTRSNQTVYQRLTIRPFYGVTVTEVDDLMLQPLTVTVALDDGTHGFLSSLGAFVDLGAGRYRLGTTNAGVTAAQASQALRALVFNPTTAERVLPGFPETTRFTITVDDRFDVATDDITTVIALHEYQTKALASDGVAGDSLGFAVAASHDVVVAGAPLADPRGSSSGAAYLYTSVSLLSTQWLQFQKLVPADGAAGDEFGNAVAISGTTIAVSAHGNRPATQTSGAVYVFDRQTTGSNLWALAKKVIPFDGANGDDFGGSVSLNNDTLVVGARADDDNGTASGSAYVFSRHQGGSNNWGFVKKLVAGDAAAGDEFGFSVDIEGDGIIVGSRFDVQGGISSGSAYLFRRHQGGTNNWGQIKKLLPLDPLGTDEFGHSVSIFGGTVAVGANRHDHPGNDMGSAYLFERDLGGVDNWGFRKELLSPTALNNDQFGYSVSLQRDELVVGVPFAGIDNQSKYGNAFAYSRHTGGPDNWGRLQEFTRYDPVNNDQFGIAVSISQGTVVVGANATDPRGNDSGSIYIYRLKYNNPPALVVPIADHFVPPNVPFSFVLPPDTFGDPDVDEFLRLSTGPLPAWVNFDPLTGTFSGLPTPAAFGAHPITVAVTDDGNASASDVFNITVGFSPPDTNGPVAIAPPDVTVECDAVPAADFAGGSVSDNTDPSPTVAYVGDVTNGVCPKLITRTYRATDWFGNSNTCSQIITVWDTVSPTLSCPADLLLTSDTNSCIATTPALGTPTVGDNCFGSVSVTNNAPATFLPGVTPVIWIAVDACGNAATCTQTVTVADSTLAITLPPASQILQPGSNAVFTVTATGCGSLAYQWYFGADTLAGETNATLTLLNVQLAQAGEYTVKVSNAGGSVTSVGALLATNIVAGDQLTIQLIPAGPLVEYRGTPGATYVLERTTHYLNWTPILTNAPLDGLIQYVETNGPAGGALYRVFKP